MRYCRRLVRFYCTWGGRFEIMNQQLLQRAFRGLGAATLALLLCLTWRSVAALAQGEGTVSYQPFVGLRTVTFHTGSGDVRVNLPDDMSAGDLISGTTVTLPGGATDA